MMNFKLIFNDWLYVVRKTDTIYRQSSNGDANLRIIFVKPTTITMNNFCI